MAKWAVLCRHEREQEQEEEVLCRHEREKQEGLAGTER